jgi:hypothetical protein
MSRRLLRCWQSRRKGMKVKELIAILSKLDQELFVVTNGYEGGIEDITYVECIYLKLNVNEGYYYGPHEEVKTEEESECCAVKIV